MKRNILLVTIVTILMIFAFVSCSDNVAPPEDRLGKITFGEESSRAVVAKVEYSQDAEDMVWFYKATKLDDGYTTGQTTDFVAVAEPTKSTSGDGSGDSATTTYSATKGLSGKTLNSDGFSYGLWKIELAGYKEADTKITGTGDASKVGLNENVNAEFVSTISSLLVEKNMNYATAKLEVGENATTDIKLGTISFKTENITANSKFTLSVTDQKGTVTVPTTYGTIDSNNKTVSFKFGENAWTTGDGQVITGDHTMEFVLSQILQSTVSGVNSTTIEAAKYTLKFTVVKGTITTIDGTLIENDATGDIEINSVQDVPELVLSKAIDVDSSTVDDKGRTAKTKAASGGSQTVNYGKDFSVTYPDDTLLNTSVEAGTLSENKTTSDAKIGFVQKDTATETGITIDANEAQLTFELTLNVDKNNTTLLTITKFIGKKLELNKIYHGTDELTAAQPQDGGEYYNYNSGTGILTLYVKHASEFNIITKKAVAEVNGTKYYSLADAIEKAATGSTITLLSDEKTKTFKKDGVIPNTSNDRTYCYGITKELTIDLNGYTIESSLTDSSSGAVWSVFAVGAGGKLTVENGKIKTTNKNAFATIHNTSGSSLTLDGVTVEAPLGITLTSGIRNVNLVVKNSVILYGSGAFGIGSNATKPCDEDNPIVVTIDNTTIKPQDSDEGKKGETGLMLNVPNKVTISDSTIVGYRQGAILRGGNYTITNTSFQAIGGTNAAGNGPAKYDKWPSVSSDPVGKNCDDIDWGTGNKVPYAALVIGNRTGNSYTYPTTVTFGGSDNKVSVATPDYWKEIYIYQKDASYPVTVFGVPETWTNINENKGNAVVNPVISAKASTDTDTKYYSSFENMIANASDNSTVTLLQDVALTESSERVEISKNLNINLAGYTLDLGNNNLTFSADVSFKNGNIVSKRNTKDPVFGDYIIRFEKALEFSNIKFRQTGLACTVLYTEEGHLTIGGNSEFDCNARESIVATYWGTTTVTIKDSKIQNNGTAGKIKMYSGSSWFEASFDPTTISIGSGSCEVTSSSISGTKQALSIASCVSRSGNTVVNATVSLTGTTLSHSDSDGFDIYITSNGKGTKSTLTADSTIAGSDLYAYACSKGNIEVSGNTIWGTVDASTDDSATVRISGSSTITPDE